MKYTDGTEAHLGDRVRVGDADTGVVVASLANDKFSAECPKSGWEYSVHRSLQTCWSEFAKQSRVAGTPECGGTGIFQVQRPRSE